MEGGIIVRNRILSKTAMVRHHLVESCNAIAFLELEHIVTNFFDDSSNIIA